MCYKLAERPLRMSPLAGSRHTDVKLAIVKFSHLLQVVEWHITQLGILVDWLKFCAKCPLIGLYMHAKSLL